MKDKKIIFKSDDGKIINFEEGWNCYGLTLRGKKEKLNSLLKKKIISNLNIKKTDITEEILEVKFIDNYGNGAHIPIETAYEILKNYPSFKYTVFWEGIIDIRPSQLYVLYSESGSCEISDSCFVAVLSSEDEYNPLLETDITEKKKKTFKYHVSDSHYGYEDQLTVKYSFPFSDKFENNNYISCQDNQIEDLPEEEELDIDLQNIDWNFLGSEDFKKINDNEKYMIKFIEYHHHWLGLVSENLRDNKEFLIQIIGKNNNINSISAISERLKNNDKFALELLKYNPNLLLDFSDNLRSNPQFMKKAIKISVSTAQFLGSKLKCDKEFILEILKKNKYSYHYLFKAISKDLFDDKDFVLECSKYGLVAYYLSDRLKDDKELLLSLPKKELTFSYASDRLKNDKDFMLKMTEKESFALSYASDNLKNDKFFVMSAIDVTKGKLPCEYDELFLDDEDVMLKRLEYNKTSLSYASDRLKNDKDFFLKALKIYEGALKYASKLLKKNSKQQIILIKNRQTKQKIFTNKYHFNFNISKK